MVSKMVYKASIARNLMWGITSRVHRLHDWSKRVVLRFHRKYNPKWGVMAFQGARRSSGGVGCRRAGTMRDTRANASGCTGRGALLACLPRDSLFFIFFLAPQILFPSWTQPILSSYFFFCILDSYQTYEKRQTFYDSISSLCTGSYILDIS
jgi:hypothetical protein